MMKNYFLFAVVLLVLWGCKTDTKAPAEVDTAFLIVPGQGFGPLQGELSRAAIAEKFDKNQVLERPFYVGEGAYEPGLVVFPDSPKEVEILLDEDGNAILYRLQREDGPWATADGLKVGSTLEDLVKVNGKPIHFMGFEWDFGGIVTDWNGGTLSGKDFMVTLTHAATDMDETDAAKIVGDQVVSSGEPALKKYNVTVARIMQNN